MNPRIKDWRYRLNHFYWIIDKDGHRVLFKENGIQKKINDCRRKRKMILKYRQGGVTTNEALKQLDFVSTSAGKTACMMADKDSNMGKIFKKVRFAHGKMPLFIRPELNKGGGSKYELEFPQIDSRIYCALEGRGDTIHWLHISEAAFANPDRIKATLEAVPINGIVTFETTAHGMNHFYKRWVDPDSSYWKGFFPWFFDENYRLNGRHVTLTADEEEFIHRTFHTFGVKIDKDQIAFRRAKQEDQQELFCQEYPEDEETAFIASGDNAFDLYIINKILKKLDTPVKSTTTLEIFKPFDSKKRYAIGADCAEGKGGDYSVATVFEIESREEVAQIRSNKWDPFDFAEEIYDLACLYHKPGREWPLVAVERNNHGHAVLLQLRYHVDNGAGYQNLYFYRDDEDSCGWQTDKVTRPIMLDVFIDGVEHGTVKLNSRATLMECLTFINNDGKLEATTGEHDDTIIAGAIATQMCIKESSNLSKYENLSDKILV